MFLTSHLMIAYILFKLLNLEANLFLFLFFSVLPDASWRFYTNHRKESWFHTVLTFSWVVFLHPYWISVLSHFIADFFSGGIRITPWDKKRIGFLKDDERVPKGQAFLKRFFKHLKLNIHKRPYFMIIELVLLITSVVLYLS